MSMNIWEAESGVATVKRYVNGKKLPQTFCLNWKQNPAHHYPNPSLEQIEERIKFIRNTEEAYAFGNAPFLIKDEWTRRLKDNLDQEEESSVFWFDVDISDKRINRFSTLQEKHSIVTELVPGLRNVGLVLFHSSSAYFFNEDKPNRISVQGAALLDKPATLAEKKAWAKQWLTEEGVKVFDTAVYTITQPLYARRGVFKNTERLAIPGPEVQLFPGERLNIDDIEIRPSGPASLSSVVIPEAAMTGKAAERLKEWKKIRDGKNFQENKRDILIKALLDENLNKFGETGELLQILTEAVKTSMNITEIDSWCKDKLREKFIDDIFPRKFKVKKISIKDLDKYDTSALETKNSCHVVRSGPGSAKTQFIRNLILSGGYKRILYVSKLKATIGPFQKKIGLDFLYYEDASEFGLQLAERLAITDKSLHKLFNANEEFLPFDLVIIDESERVLGNITDTGSKQKELFALCEAADCVALLDADASGDVTGWYAEQLGKEHLTLIHNTKDWMEDGHSVTVYDDEQIIFQRSLDWCKAGDFLAVFTSSANQQHARRRQQELLTFFADNGYVAEAYNAESCPDELKRNPNRFIEERKDAGVQVLILSPLFVIGWDYLGKYTFDKNIGLYYEGYTTGEDIAQQMRRMRLTKDHHLYLPKRSLERGEYDYFEKLDKASSVLRKLPKTITEELAIKVKARRKNILGNVRFHAISIFKDRGAKVFINSEEAKVKPFDRKEIRRKNDKEEINKLWAEDETRGLVYSEFETKEGKSVFSTTKAVFRNLTREHSRVRAEEGKIRQLSKLWFADDYMRAAWDAEAYRYNELTGALLNEVDNLVGLEPAGFLGFIRDPEQEQFAFILDVHRAKQCQAILKREYSEIRNHVPFFNLAAFAGKKTEDVKTGKVVYETPSPIVFIKQMCNFFGLELLDFGKLPRKLGAKDIKAGLIDYYKEKGILKQYERENPNRTRNDKEARWKWCYEFLKQRAGVIEELNEAEKQALAYKGEVYSIKKKPYRSRTIIRAIEGAYQEIMQERFGNEWMEPISEFQENL